MISADLASSNIPRAYALINGSLQGINYKRNKMPLLPDAKLELGPMCLLGMSFFFLSYPWTSHMWKYSLEENRKTYDFMEQIIIIWDIGRDFENSAIPKWTSTSKIYCPFPVLVWFLIIISIFNCILNIFWKPMNPMKSMEYNIVKYTISSK